MRKGHVADNALSAAAVLVGALGLGLIFWRFKADPMWAIISFVLVFDPESRGVVRAGMLRLALTIFGSMLALAVVYSFGLHKWTLPVGVTIAALICGFLRLSASGWRVTLVTVALIIGSSLLQASAGPYIAVARSIEVSAGSLAAIALSLGVSAFRKKRH